LTKLGKEKESRQTSILTVRRGKHGQTRIRNGGRKKKYRKGDACPQRATHLRSLSNKRAVKKLHRRKGKSRSGIRGKGIRKKKTRWGKGEVVSNSLLEDAERGHKSMRN